MSNDDLPDDFRPGIQLEPLKGFEELADVLDPVTGSMYGRFGIKGMTIEEAAKNAETWWNNHGRKQMPDYNKPQQYLEGYGTKSGILLGLPWAALNRGEKIRVVKVWHNEIGIPKHGMGFSSHQGKDYKNVLEQAAREQRIRSFDLPRIFGTPAGETSH